MLLVATRVVDFFSSRCSLGQLTWHPEALSRRSRPDRRGHGRSWVERANIGQLLLT